MAYRGKADSVDLECECGEVLCAGVWWRKPPPGWDTRGWGHLIEAAVNFLKSWEQPKVTEPHSFAGYGADCELCGEGRCHYLHAEDMAAEDPEWDGELDECTCSSNPCEPADDNCPVHGMACCPEPGCLNLASSCPEHNKALDGLESGKEQSDSRGVATCGCRDVGSKNAKG